MRALLGSGMRKGVEAARKIASQVVVSVIATGCAALITNGYLKPSAGPETAPASVASAAPVPVLDPQAAVGLMRATFTDDGIRVRGAYPAEFQAVFGPNDAPVALGLAAGTKAAAPQPKPAHKPVVAAAEACSDACGRPLVATVLPPVRPADLTPMAAVVAQSASVAEAREHIRLLGVPLPHFVPSGEEVVKTVASWGGTIAGLAVGE